MKKNLYQSPSVKLMIVEIESGIAAGSANDFTIGGPGGTGLPEIDEANTEERQFDISL